MSKCAQLLTVLFMIVVSCTGLTTTSTSVGSVSFRAGQRAERNRRSRRNRVIVYMQDVDDHIDDDQLRQVTELCAGRGYVPVSFVQEEPGQIGGLIDALRMVRRGEADRIVMASRAALPDLFESATQELPRPVDRELPVSHRRTARIRRIRPTRREDEGA